MMASAADDLASLELRGRGGHEIEDLPLFRFRWVVDVDLQEEAIELGLGEGVSSLLVDRVLGRHDQEGVRQRVGRITDRHLPLLHGFEEGALHLGRRAVDLVGEDEVGEDRPEFGDELAVLGVVDQGADQVGR